MIESDLMKPLLLLLAVLGTASGQTELSLSDAVHQALAAHPLLEVGAQQIAASEALRRQAGLRPNPTFVFQQENIRFSGNSYQHWTDTDTFAFLSQPIETSGKRQKRIDVAGFEVRRAELGRELLTREIAGRVKRAYWAAAGAQRIHELLLEAAKNFLLTVEYHEVRVREGAMAEADLLRIRLESERLHMAASDAFLQAEQARISLFRQMGLSDFPDAVQYEPLTGPDGERRTADPNAALAQRTDMKLARLAGEEGQAVLRLEQARSRPDLGAILGYKRTAGFNTLMAGVEVGLPLWDRNQGNVGAAAARIAAARAEAESMSAVVRAEVAVALKDCEIRRRQIMESLRPMLKQATESSNIAQAAYREGGWDLLRLLDAERLRIETESLYYQALAAYHQSAVALETALGLEP